MKEKIIIVGDIHLGKESNGDISLFETFVEKILLPECDKDTVVIFTGDQFEGSYINIILLNKVINVFNKINESVKFCHFLVGNHDSYKLDNVGENMSSIFNLWDNFQVWYDDKVIINDKSFHFLSFSLDITKIRKSIEDSDSNYLIIHEEISEFFYDKFRPINGGIGLSELEKFELVFDGHIHRKQTKGNCWIVGTPYQMKYSDSGNLCGMHILDTETNGVRFVENTHYPKYHKLTYKEITDENFDTNLISGNKVWVTDIEDEEIVKKLTMSVVELRTNIKGTDTIVTENFTYDHEEDIIRNTGDYLKELKEVPISNKVLGMNPTLKKDILDNINKL